MHCGTKCIIKSDIIKNVHSTTQHIVKNIYGSAGKDAAEFIATGEKWARMGNYKKAVEEFQKALDEDPENVDAWYKYAKAQRFDISKRFAAYENAYRLTVEETAQTEILDEWISDIAEGELSSIDKADLAKHAFMGIMEHGSESDLAMVRERCFDFLLGLDPFELDDDGDDVGNLQFLESLKEGATELQQKRIFAVVENAKHLRQPGTLVWALWPDGEGFFYPGRIKENYQTQALINFSDGGVETVSFNHIYAFGTQLPFRQYQATWEGEFHPVTIVSTNPLTVRYQDGYSYKITLDQLRARL
jgi:tetratricopeptide (TPR) repeat protein